ncbi:hypothetical protein ACFOYY_04885 [Streptosporangium jomthongense]|uniref:Uncharacterized protein n=1 Tax=Streptosporangium jomthongense TaxID=1193683 RepID=A0ABV8EV26_9ACTN
MERHRRLSYGIGDTKAGDREKGEYGFDSEADDRTTWYGSVFAFPVVTRTASTWITTGAGGRRARETPPRPVPALRRVGP